MTNKTGNILNVLKTHNNHNFKILINSVANTKVLFSYFQLLNQLLILKVTSSTCSSNMIPLTKNLSLVNLVEIVMNESFLKLC